MSWKLSERQLKDEKRSRKTDASAEPGQDRALSQNYEKRSETKSFISPRELIQALEKFVDNYYNKNYH